MLVRRGLIAVGGGGAFTLPPSSPPAAAFDVSAPPYGTGTDIQWPMAIYGNGMTYIGLIQGETDENDVSIIAYDHATEMIVGPVAIHDQLNDGASTIPDTHNQPAVAIRADGHIVVAYCGHGSTTLRTKISDDPWDITGGFTAAETIVSSYALTYPQLFVMSGGRIYMRARAVLSGVAYILQWYSDDGAETWDIGTLIFTEGTSNIYSAAATDGDYIDQVLIDRSPDFAGGWWMGHFRQDETGDNFQTDGTPIAGSYPLGASDMTEVFAPGSYRFPRGITYDAGEPVIAWDSAQADPVLMGESRWDGVDWVPETIVTSTPVYSFATSTGGGKHTWDDPDHFYAGVVLGSDPIDDGGAIEIFRFTRTAGVWDSGTQITSSGENPYAPFTVVDADADLVMLWTTGDQAPADGDPFSLGLQGVGA